MPKSYSRPRLIAPAFVMSFVLPFTIIVLASSLLQSQATAQPATVATLPTADECQQLALRVERSINAGAPVGLDQAIDLDAIIDRSLQDWKLSPEQARRFRDGASDGFSLGQEICAALHNGGSYRFLRVVQRQGQPVLLFRLLTSGGLNYHEMYVAKDAQGKLRIVDVYIQLMGEKISQALALGLPVMAAKAAATQRAKLPQAFLDAAAEMEKLRALQQLAAEGKFKQAIDALSKLPATLRNSKGALMMRYQYAQQVDVEHYRAAIAALTKAFPNDPFLDLILLESLALEEKYTEILNSLDRIDRRLGGDPYIDFLRSRQYFAMEKFDLAKAMAQKSIRAEPWLHDPYWLLIDIAIKQKDHRSTAKLLVAIERRLRVTILVKNVEESAAYAEFIKSPNFKKWAKPRAIAQD